MLLNHLYFRLISSFRCTCQSFYLLFSPVLSFIPFFFLLLVVWLWWTFELLNVCAVSYHLPLSCHHYYVFVIFFFFNFLQTFILPFFSAFFSHFIPILFFLNVYQLSLSCSILSFNSDLFLCLFILNHLMFFFSTKTLLNIPWFPPFPFSVLNNSLLLCDFCYRFFVFFPAYEYVFSSRFLL